MVSRGFSFLNPPENVSQLLLTIGSFLLTVEGFYYLQLCLGVLLLRVGASLLTIGASFAYSGKFRARKRHINVEHLNFLKVGTTRRRGTILYFLCFEANT